MGALVVSPTLLLSTITFFLRRQERVLPVVRVLRGPGIARRVGLHGIGVDGARAAARNGGGGGDDSRHPAPTARAAAALGAACPAARARGRAVRGPREGQLGAITPATTTTTGVCGGAGLGGVVHEGRLKGGPLLILILTPTSSLFIRRCPRRAVDEGGGS